MRLKANSLPRAKTPCICHPDRVSHTRSGLCGYCYNKQLEQVNPELHDKKLEATRRWRRAVKGSKIRMLTIRNNNLRRYGITIEDYEALLTKQDNKCAICKQTETEVLRGKVRPLCVDHNHETGKVRGLLCSSCNIALGKFKDSKMNLESAILYLGSA